MSEMVFDMLERAVRQVPGWSPSEQLLSLYELALSSSFLGNSIIEIGAWCGRSTVALGKAAELGGSRVQTVDIFPERDDWQQLADGNYCVDCVRMDERVQFGQETSVWKEPYEKTILPVYDEYGSPYQKFLQTLDDFNIRDFVEVNRMSIFQFEQRAKDSLRAHLIFIDGDHSYSALQRDISIAERFLVPGGWLCFDDAFTVYDGISKAIQERIVNSGKYELMHQPSRKMFVARLSMPA